MLLIDVSCACSKVRRQTQGEAALYNARPDNQLSFIARIADPLFAVMAPGHSLATRKSLSLEDLTGVSVALPALSFGIRRLIDDECKSGKINLAVGMTSNSIEALKSFARSNSGVTFLPSLAIRSDLDAGKLVGTPLREQNFRRTMHDVCVLAGRTLPPAVVQFAADLASIATPGILSAEAVTTR